MVIQKLYGAQEVATSCTKSQEEVNDESQRPMCKVSVAEEERGRNSTVWKHSCLELSVFTMTCGTMSQVRVHNQSAYKGAQEEGLQAGSVTPSLLLNKYTHEGKIGGCCWSSLEK